MASYEPSSYPPPPHPGVRSRNSSTASARYTPPEYQAPALQGPPAQPSGGYHYAYGMPTSRVSPMTRLPSTEAYPDSGRPVPPENTLHPATAARSPYPTASTEPYMSRISYDAERRHSHSSQHSRRSHDSHRSQKSHRSQRSLSEERDSERRHRRRETERRHSDYGDPLKRRDTHKPTFGDTIYAVLGGLKSYLGPR